MSDLYSRRYGRELYKTFQDGIKKEWVITNGLGSYAGSSVIGANTRKHHGLLIASLHAPTNRFVCLNRIDEQVIIQGKSYNLSSVQRAGGVYQEGLFFQTGFSFDVIPSFAYFVKGVSIQKEIAYEWNKNTVAMSYVIKNLGDDAILKFTPSFNFRDHNLGSTTEDLVFETKLQEEELILIPDKNKEIRIRFYKSEGNFTNSTNKYDEDIELQTEIDTGMSSSDTGYTPVHVELEVPKGSTRKISFVCSIEDEYNTDAFATIDKARIRGKELVQKAGFNDAFSNSLVVAADNFIVRRESTDGKTILAGLPWFTDWGRDTMIALTGLTLCTKRYDDAKSILATFAKYEKNGIIPNMFPDEGMEPLYNTVDASLWYFYCIDMYLKYVGSDEAYEWVKECIYPTLKSIQYHYENGTDFSIKMDEDGLIMAGSDLDQVTWMDVRINGYVVTPRHGKPVEINALWFNALCVLEKLARKYDESEYADRLKNLEKQVSCSFAKRFYNEKTGCLYDVVDEVQRDGITKKDNDKIRPNQVWAVSLPYTMLDRDKEKKVIETVMTKLYTDYGLRTLPVDDKEYHGVYKGELVDRDYAYHQGTAWAFPMGGFIEGYLKINDYSLEAKETAMQLLEPMKHHLDDGCIGGIAEIFDGDAPHISRGCYSQAWSVGEILRAYALLV